MNTPLEYLLTGLTALLLLIYLVIALLKPEWF
ncbi:potassium-transporting ATPase subunit F [Thermogemmatispora sp.]|nr:potassium-transporting ATPase subunit F [Thermogemmatispora sp.]MBX5448554.1 potassium-transporting ATPase subunit F [Thermogemmatispora sp.]